MQTIRPAPEIKFENPKVFREPIIFDGIYPPIYLTINGIPVKMARIEAQIIDQIFV